MNFGRLWVIFVTRLSAAFVSGLRRSSTLLVLWLVLVDLLCLIFPLALSHFCTCSRLIFPLALALLLTRLVIDLLGVLTCLVF